MVQAASAVAEPEDDVVRISVADPDHALVRAGLYQELERPYDGPEPAWHDGVWSVELSTRGALRIEYVLSLRYADGSVETGPDPACEGRAPGPFGEKSVVRSTFPSLEHDQYIAHFRGLLGAWAHDERLRLG